MDTSSKVTQWMVDQLVDPEYQAQVIEQYKGISMDSIRLAWPFKTDEERAQIAKWLRQQRRKQKQKQADEHAEKYGKAFL